ncbi:MAG: HAD family phosphatase [Lachnospiraceae bacterium]|nr:HAD family phosphatase [Lachnospiraceae bacterium]
MEIRLIAFDLDGTLLDDHKKVSERSLRALEAAVKKGVILVPATGRIRNAIPKAVMDLPLVRYLITLNGAVVWDLEKEERIYQKIFSKEQSLALWDYITQFDAMCDIYEDGQGYMEPGNLAMLEKYVHFPEMIQLVRDTRKVIPSIREYLVRLDNGVEKFNMYFEDRELQARVKEELKRFSYLKATTSVINNIELNHVEADKGRGLTALCEYLGISKEQVMAFGDGDNDIAMLTAAGCGVAMKNAEPSVKEQADRIAESNNEDGLARMIEEYIL